MPGPRIDWVPVIERARVFVESREPGTVTLRTVFYRLVIEALIPNVLAYYKRLSDRTAKARRAGEFPDLFDRGRSIHRYMTYPSPEAALDRLARTYRRDRTEGQEMSLYLGVEKAGHVTRLLTHFGALGIPILALGGYASQSYVKEIAAEVEARRPSGGPVVRRRLRSVR